MIQCASIHAYIYRRHGIVFFIHLQITIARAYISKSIHVAFRNESSLNIYVHICFLNENCYGKSRAECEKSRSSQPYFSTIQKYLLSSVRQWERIETNRYKKMFVLVCTFQNSIVFVLWLSGGYCCFAAVWRLFFCSSSRLLSHSLHAKQ